MKSSTKSHKKVFKSPPKTPLRISKSRLSYMSSLKEPSKISLTPKSFIKKAMISLLKLTKEIPNTTSIELTKTLETFSTSLESLTDSVKHSIQKQKISQKAQKLSPLEIFKESFDIFSNYLKYVRTSKRKQEIHTEEQQPAHQEYNDFYREFEFTSTTNLEKKTLDFELDVCQDAHSIERVREYDFCSFRGGYKQSGNLIFLRFFRN